MENNQKTQAELYREERKKRLEKAAKKNAKKNPNMQKAGKIATKVVAIAVIVVAALVAIGATLNFFGLPQRVLTAAKAGDIKISVAEYNCYYMNAFTQVHNTAQTYDTYYGKGAGLTYVGFDSTKTPREQKYTKSELEGYQNPTWADYFEVSALENAKYTNIYAKLAEDAGIKLTDEEQKEIDDAIESLRKAADEKDYSLDRFLRLQLGNGVNEKIYREIMTKQQLAAKFAKTKQTEVKDGITDAAIDAEYKENAKDYSSVTVYLFEVEAKPDIKKDATDDEKKAAQEKAMEDAKKNANAYLSNINDVNSFVAQAKRNDKDAKEEALCTKMVSYSTLSSSGYGEETAKWAFDANRKVGDKAVIELSDGYAVAYITELPAKNTFKPVDVRHILVEFGSKEGTAPTAKQKEDAKKKADEIFDKFKKDPTVENFAALAKENTADTGSKETGGLYEKVVYGQMVSAFNNWIFDAARKSGDTGMVETEFGYHIMYYVGNDYEETWKDSVRTVLATEALEAYETEVFESDSFKLDKNDTILNWAVKQLEKSIVKYSIY